MTTRRTLLRTAPTASGLAALGTLLAACGTDTTDSSTPGGTGAALDPRAAELLAGYDIVADTAEEAVTALDQSSAPRPLTVSGSVGYGQVSLADDSAEVTVPLTGGQFYLSMAPYRTRPTKLREASAAVKRLVKS